MIRYEMPDHWIRYDHGAIARELAEAKAALIALKTMPYQKGWVEELQHQQFKREVAGTSRIEGADFTEPQLEAALSENPDQLFTRSQRQAHAAVQAYRWIATLPDDRPVDADLIRRLHSIIVTGADDDHCPPGRIREREQNVVFGVPQHRGVQGGEECRRAFTRLCQAVQREFQDHDPLVQALALHYHFAAMHPFLDGNGRTARALEALLLRRAGLRDVCFIPMSNYYYEEKREYLTSLASVRAGDHDLTRFLAFGLKGIAIQCHELLAQIRTQVAKALFRNVMFDLFHRLRTPKKRVILDRQLEILKLLLNKPMRLSELVDATHGLYQSLKSPSKALVRDLNHLIQLGAIEGERLPDDRIRLEVRLSWPTEITETEFFKRIKNLPKAKTHSMLQY